MKPLVEVKLGDVAEFVRGITFKPEDVCALDQADAVACMRTKNVQAALDLSDVWAVHKDFVKRKEQFLQEGDILVSTANSWNLVGKCCWTPALPWPATLGGFISALRADRQKVSPRFLYHWFNSPRIQAVVRNCGRQTTNISNMSVERCLATQFPLFHITEQQRIAATLDQADSLRIKRRQSLAKLDTIAQSIFFDLCGDPAINPKHWICDTLGGHLLFVTSGGRGWAEYYSGNGSRFIRSLDVQMNYIGSEDVVYVTPPDSAEARRTMVQAGDVLLTITGSRIGRVAAVSEEFAGSYVSQHVAILRPNPETIESQFLSFFLSMESGGQRQIARHQYGQTKPGLNFDSIARFRIPVPPISIQRDFVQRLKAVQWLNSKQETSASKLDALFASLQHRAFRGEL